MQPCISPKFDLINHATKYEHIMLIVLNLKICSNVTGNIMKKSKFGNCMSKMLLINNMPEICRENAERNIPALG